MFMSTLNKKSITMVKEEVNLVEELEAKVVTEEEVVDLITPCRFARCAARLDMLLMSAIIILIIPAMLSNNLYQKEMLRSKLSILKTISIKFVETASPSSITDPNCKIRLKIKGEKSKFPKDANRLPHSMVIGHISILEDSMVVAFDG
ncbi:hypothetical protein LWI28_023227 [Acer negundo]|uniref:Uncharacterized protein n=1 Tax=Acer negundo TaxID=4023 RepID=A0AAD5IKD4_ACENE|nr:hypothetical protein LWI28_023227 [Acer negundo]